MSKRLALWLVALGCACLVTTLSFPFPRSGVLGLIRGENFYRGGPSNYWRKLVRECPKTFPYQAVLPPARAPVQPATEVDELKKYSGLR